MVYSRTSLLLGNIDEATAQTTNLEMESKVKKCPYLNLSVLTPNRYLGFRSERNEKSYE